MSEGLFRVQTGRVTTRRISSALGRSVLSVGVAYSSSFPRCISLHATAVAIHLSWGKTVRSLYSLYYYSLLLGLLVFSVFIQLLWWWLYTTSIILLEVRCYQECVNCLWGPMSCDYVFILSIYVFYLLYVVCISVRLATSLANEAVHYYSILFIEWTMTMTSKTVT